MIDKPFCYKVVLAVWENIMAKLWQKKYTLNTLMEDFTVGRDFELDQKLVTSDCIASAAHGIMLHSIGILSDGELDSIKNGLVEILKLKEQNNFSIKKEYEDCHTAIENYLTNTAGEAGKKIHTGRSRNDQVITALRVWARDFLFSFAGELTGLIDSLISFAETNKMVPMPGRTHMQIAMPSSVGLWAGAFAEELSDDLKLVFNSLDIIDQSPLGSAASYGVPLPLNREYTAELLGFSRIQNNVLYVNNSRGKFESIILEALDQTLLSLSKMAQDLILFSLPEFAYFTLPPELCSGSSIMPQKKNPDGLELMRAKSGSVSAYAAQVKNIIRSLPSGYNRDFQETKEPFLRGCDLSLQCVGIMGLTIDKLEVNAQNLLKAFTPGIFATDAALKLVSEGKSFRDAYREVGLNLEGVTSGDPVKGITTRTSTGTAGNLNLEPLKKRNKAVREDLAERKSRVDRSLSSLLSYQPVLYA